MGKTAHFEWPWPVEGAEADPPLDLEKLAKAIEAVVHLLPVSELRTAEAGDANKLLVVQGTGAPAWGLMKGDATFAADGTLSIGGEKVTEAMIKALAVGAGKLAVESVISTKLAEEAVTALKIAKLAVEEKHLKDGAVTSRKFKPTIGLIGATADLALGGAFADIPGAKLEITPAVASMLKITAFFHFLGTSGSVALLGTLGVDGADQARHAQLNYATGVVEGNATVGGVWLISLTAVAHTIKLRAKKESADPAAVGKCLADNTSFVYELVAA